MKVKRFATGITLILITLFSCVETWGQSWNEFRGINGTGHSTFTGLPVKWSDDSENLDWKVALPGLGWSSPVLEGTNIWLTSAIEGDDKSRLVVLCVDLESGKILKEVTVFEKSLGRIHKKNSHASPSAIVDGERVFVHFGEHGTACLDTQGNVLWKRAFDYGHFHGPGGSPVVVDDKLILSCDGGEKQFLIALDKSNGQTIWQTEKKHIHPARFSGGKMAAIAFSTPTLREVDGKVEVICPGADHIAGFDAESGKEIWWAAYDGYSVVPRPIISGDMVFYASSYDAATMYGLKLGGRGEITDQIVWETRKGAPHNPTPILVGELLYMVSDRGIGHCLDAKTGKVLWQKRMGRAYSASPIFADGRIYFQDEKGGTIVIKPGTEYSEVARSQLSGRTLATPVPVQGALLIRTDSQLLKISGTK